MPIRFEDKSYNTKIFRPRPEVHLEPDGSLLIVATPWGGRSAARKAIRVIQDYFLSTRQDMEATSPFARLNCLSPMGNDLRVATKLASDSVYNEDNKEEYTSGLELFVLARNREETVWIQIGHPFVILDRPGDGLVPLGNQQDFANEFSKPPNSLPPLPSHFVGIENSSDFAVESMRTQAADKFILLSASSIPYGLYALSENDRSLQGISNLMAKKKPDAPFWLGLCHFT